MEVVVEVLNHGSRVVEHKRQQGKVCRIGRAYDNDVIISEPHVCAHHAKLWQDENDRLWLTDTGSMNGIRSRRYQKLQGDIEVKSGDEFLIGLARIRFYQPDHRLPATLGLGIMDSALQYFSKPLPFMMQLLVLFSSLLLLEYYRFYQPFAWKDFLPLVLSAPILAVFWAGIWAFIGRVVRHEPRFITQMAVAVAYITSIEWLTVIIENLAFNANSNNLVQVLSYLSHALLFSLLIALNLRVATHIAGIWRWVVACSTGVLLVVSVLLSQFLLQAEFETQPQYSGVLQPPMARWQTPVELPQLFELMKKQLPQASGQSLD